MEDQIMEPQEPKKGKGKTILLVLLGLLLGGSSVFNYMLYHKAQTSSAMAQSNIDSLSQMNLLKDSLYQMIAEEEASVASLRLEISLYQSENDSLKQILELKEQKILALRSQIGGSGGSPKKLRALKDSLEKMVVVNNEFKTQVQTLLMENEDYRAQLLANKEKIEALNSSNQKLTDKVIIAAEPNVGPVIVTPMYNKKGIDMPIYKAKKVEKLSITFDVLGNQLTEKTVEKTYNVRIKDPDGIVLSNDNGSLMDSNDVFTVREKVSFDGTQKRIKIDFKQDPKFKKGRYKVELKDGDEVKNTFTFELM
ncbi:MAG: hypothetical protein PSX81_12335 [bacterium]|nr:hypothetical protein [bacterium]